MWLRTGAVLASLLGVAALGMSMEALGDSVTLPSGEWVPSVVITSWFLIIFVCALPMLFAFSDRMISVGKQPYVAICTWLTTHPKLFWYSYMAFVALLVAVGVGFQ